MKFFSDFVNRFGRNNLIVVAAIVALLIIGFFLLLGKSPLGQLVSNKPTLSVTPTAGPIPTPTRVPSNTIMITDRRALPKSLTIKKLTEINFINLSGDKIDIESADENNKELNIGVIADNQTSKVIVFKTAGTYKYTNTLNPKVAGEIIIE